ncbi:MAG TPA: glycosyltransferase family 87 protein, partial [Myxococcota bacterium]|nr:glycosyltransferase family 87 protein [Myxococcota bacterium]
AAWLAPRVDGVPPPPGLRALWAIGVVGLLLGQSVRTATAMVDPSFAAGAAVPFDAKTGSHACLTAYVHGSILADRGQNPYDLSYEPLPDEPPRDLPPTAAHMAPFKLDLYGYGPPFLALPRLMRLVTEDFLSLRAMFGAFNVALSFFAAGLLAWHLGGDVGRRMWWVGPIALATPTALAAANISNFHLAMVAMCAMAWVAFERGRDWIGGALLAFVILAKIAPGLLGVVLLARRQWRAAGATAIAAVVITASSLPAAGLPVWEAFIHYYLPKLSSGEAFAFFDRTREDVLLNLSPFGLPFLLTRAGVADLGWEAARRVQDVFTIALAVIAIGAGRRDGPPAQRAASWLAVLTLATLRSPFAAVYVACAALFALLPMLGEPRRRSGVVGYALAWLFIETPAIPTGTRADFFVSTARILLCLALCTWVALRRWGDAPFEPAT